MVSNKVAKTVIILLIIAFIAFAAAGAVFIVTERPHLLSGFTDEDRGDGPTGELNGIMETRIIDEDHTFTFDDVKRIDTKTVASDISIIPVDSGDIRVHYYGTYTGNFRMMPIIRLDYGTLNAREEYSRKLFSSRITASDIRMDIYVPAQYLGDIKAETVSGNVTMEAVGPKKLDFDTVSGDINVKSAVVPFSTFNTVSGSIMLDGFEGAIDFDTVSGDIEAVLSNLKGNIEVGTVSGRTKLTLPQDTDFILRTHSVSGKVECDFPLVLNKSSGKNSLDGRSGTGGYKIEVSSISGAISILER